MAAKRLKRLRIRRLIHAVEIDLAQRAEERDLLVNAITPQTDRDRASGDLRYYLGRAAALHGVVLAAPLVDRITDLGRAGHLEGS